MSDGPVLLDGYAIAACGCGLLPVQGSSLLASVCASHVGQMSVAIFPATKRAAVERALRGEA